jgi:hypothetical protein
VRADAKLGIIKRRARTRYDRGGRQPRTTR